MKKYNKSIISVYLSAFASLILILIFSMQDRILNSLNSYMIYDIHLSGPKIIISLLIFLSFFIPLNVFIYIKAKYDKPLFYRIIPRTKNDAINVLLYIAFSMMYVLIITAIALFAIVLFGLICALIVFLGSEIKNPLFNEIIKIVFMIIGDFIQAGFGFVFDLSYKLLSPEFWIEVVSIFGSSFLIVIVNLSVAFLINRNKKDEVKKISLIRVSYYISIAIPLIISLCLFVYAVVNVIVTCINGNSQIFLFIKTLFLYDKISVCILPLLFCPIIMDIILSIKNCRKELE